MPRNRIKITVERILEVEKTPLGASCPIGLQPGDEFMLESYTGEPRYRYSLTCLNRDQQFCDWALSDIYKQITALQFGADFPWREMCGTELACCTDGAHPVVMKLERIEYRGDPEERRPFK